MIKLSLSIIGSLLTGLLLNTHDVKATGSFALIGPVVYHIDVQCSIPPYTPQCAQIVEQQTSTGVKYIGDWSGDPALWVINPYNDKPWSADDAADFGGQGILDPGQTWSYTLNYVADWQTHEFILAGLAEKNASFIVTITNPVKNQSFSISSSQVNRQYAGATVTICGIQYMHSSPPLQQISGSNGGIGIIQPVTYSITNTGTRQIKNGSVTGHIQLLGQFSECNQLWNGN